MIKLAIIGSRSLSVSDKIILTSFPCPHKQIGEIVSGGARGIDSCARLFAGRHGIPLTEFLPDYARHGRRAPLVRNAQIAAYADMALAFMAGRSPGTSHAIAEFRKLSKHVTIIQVPDSNQLSLF